LTIAWNQRVFHLIKMLEKGRKFNGVYHATEILSPLSEWRSMKAGGNEGKLIMHANSARPQMAKISP
jgi:hypothetical protein